MANAQNPPEKRAKQVIKGEAIIRKKSALAKIRDAFIAEDADKVGSYILLDVLVPSIKKAIVDIIKSSADMIFGTKGSSQSSGTRYVYGGGSSIYTTYSSSPKKQQDLPQSNRDLFDFSFVEFSRFSSDVENRNDAETVVEEMCNIIDAYKEASVADLCDILRAPYEFTANNYGWKNLNDLAPIKIPGTNGYYLRFPKAVPIGK